MSISPFYIILLMVVGVLVFGKDLPDVMRKLGSAVMEFRKGMSDVSLKSSVNKGVDSKSNLVGGVSSKFETPLVDVIDSDAVATFSDNKFEPPK
ncbi:MAG: twin-arginine translocase TatA/TatE family subunit [Planctomycetaceae bacterium]|jgi:TatA/E family protein of Tat protein translocase|nr:twin-arginine translocase TatA/TatE family subunit [Planctomycetaceae bacterium]